MQNRPLLLYIVIAMKRLGYNGLEPVTVVLSLCHVAHQTILSVSMHAMYKDTSITMFIIIGSIANRTCQFTGQWGSVIGAKCVSPAVHGLSSYVCTINNFSHV